MSYPTITISKCCKAPVVEDEKPKLGDHTEFEPILVCEKCEKECDTEEVCAECHGDGEVTTMERVYAGEPHMAPIGTATCPACGGKG